MTESSRHPPAYRQKANERRQLFPHPDRACVGTPPPQLCCPESRHPMRSDISSFTSTTILPVGLKLAFQPFIMAAWPCLCVSLGLDHGAVTRTRIHRTYPMLVRSAT